MKQLFLTALCFITISTFAQKKKTDETPAPTQSQSASADLFSAQMNVYKNALKFYDTQTATTALYNAIALQPERADLYDSLTYLYFAAERYGQVFLLGEDLLKKDNSRNDIREMVAIAKQSLNLAKESLEDYEKLYAATKQLQYLYQVATLQYQLKRYGECVASLDQIIGNEEADQLQMAIRNQDGSNQNVPMKAAAYNVKGICALELNQEDAAKQNFDEAVKLFPDFTLAKNNLEFIAQKKAQSNSAATAPKGK